MTSIVFKDNYVVVCSANGVKDYYYKTAPKKRERLYRQVEVELTWSELSGELEAWLNQRDKTKAEEIINFIKEKINGAKAEKKKI